MNKIFIIAAVAVLPVFQNLSSSEFKIKEPVYIFNYKNTAPSPFLPKTKTTEEKPDQNWMATAQENIRKSEYNFTWEEKYKAYCTPNRKNNLRFFYDDKGFVVEPRVTKIPIGDVDLKATPDEIKYKTIPNWKLNFNLDKKQLGNGKWQIVNNKAAYITEKITVEYVNKDDGMRQNFIVQSPLSTRDELKINFSIKTKLKTYLHGNQLQFFHNKTNVLNYDQLKVWDANGKPLQAFIQKNRRNRYYIKVETKGAVYPVTIDPLSSTPNSTPDDANQAGANFGRSATSAGDVDGDGYSDVIIGANRFDDGANTDEGRAYIYHGSATGLSASPNSILDDANQAGGSFGWSVASAGDVNGDGYSDVIIGAPNFNDGVNSAEGRAFVYHGSATGLAATPNNIPNDADQAGSRFGTSVACAGDVNGDGYSDVVIGAAYYNDGGNASEGRAFVYHGSATGLAANPNNTPNDADQVGARFGTSVACAGDVNGDGYSDVIIGAAYYDDGAFMDEGRAFIYYGSTTGLSASPGSTPDDANEFNANFGISVASAGDVNGDGYSDVIIGAPQCDNGDGTVGAAFIYHGSAAGLAASPNSRRHDASTTVVNSFFGVSVACAGDVNGDGYSDVIIGAWQYSEAVNSTEGRAYVYHGSATGVAASPNSTPDDANQEQAYFGFSVASAGDVNGDGYSDVIIGALFYDDGANVDEGRAFVYHGSAAGLSASPTSMPDDANQAQAFLGYSVAGAGDINADGYSDVIIGAYGFDDGVNTDEGRAFVYHGSASGLSATPSSTPDDANQAGAQFGRSVAGAGDINGDGYGDIVIGAQFYDDGVNNAEGRAFVYHGSAAGLSASPNITLGDANQPLAGFGTSVAGAGDVNGDGYGDVIIGAANFDDGANADEGRAFVYHGSAAGLSATPNSTPDDANQAGAQFGASVASAGDVNGDGYCDVIIGAASFDDGVNNSEGRAFIYHGSATGLSASPNNIPDDANQAFAYFGASVASAGDVNGDGYGDIIIGAYGYDDGANIDEGRAYLYHGSATGLSASPNNIPDDANQAGAGFGRSVANAGDVNGDGYSDVIIGCYNFDDGANTSEGRAFVYHGSAAGLSTSPASTLDDANQATANFGISVACAGDINGDGYSDVIIGAYSYDDGANTNEGRSLIYNGNEFTTNERNNLRLYNTNLTTPINSSNFIIGNFGAGLFAKSFLGRNRGKLVWQTRLNYNAYSGNPITNSVLFTSQQTSYTNLGTAGVELKNVISKINGASKYTKLRARVKYSPALAITGQVYGPWRYVSSIIDGNKLGALPLDLISFNAAWKEKGKTAKLDFVTDKESGICCFDIEKSTNGFNYITIGTVAAKNTGGVQQYSYVDNNASSKNQFYRLVIKGMDGKIENSNIQQLQNNGSAEILMFPNPTTDVLQLNLNGSFTKMNVQIISVAGQVVKKLNNISPINQIISIPVQSLPAGAYWLQLQSGDEKQVLQFVKH